MSANPPQVCLGYHDDPDEPVIRLNDSSGGGAGTPAWIPTRAGMIYLWQADV